MSSRYPRPAAPRGPVAPVHRGPQALPPGAQYGYAAPNAALLIDFDNVTMGIQKDMQAELRNLLSSDIIKGKVSVQRAYADWRRYPSYVVPLTENSIDLIFAPAYGSAKKNATDIRLAIDAMELVFTRPEIGTFILLSGDSDFSSLVIKLKEYGKYVIGVGIRESASDLLVQNCDEYYSYNALAGLVNTRDEEQAQRCWDPYELVAEAVQRMVRDGDTMRADRLKQVMQDIDASFDEKDLGMAKFSRFVTEAESRGLLAVTRLDSGQYEIAPGPKLAPAPVREGREPRREEPRRDEGRRDAGTVAVEAGLDAEADAEAERERVDRGRRRGRGRGRDRDVARYPRTGAEPGAEEGAKVTLDEVLEAPVAPAIGTAGERLTRAEAFDLVRRATESLTENGAATTTPPAVRERAFALLGRDSESLGDRMFDRILRDAADAGLVELRRDGDALAVARSAQAPSVADQFNRAAAATQAPAAADANAPRGMGNRGLPRGRGGRGPAGPPPELLLVGVVQPAPGAGAPTPNDEASAGAVVESPAITDAGEAVTAALGVGAGADATAAAPQNGAVFEVDAAPAPVAEAAAPSAAPVVEVLSPARGNLRGRGRGGRGGVVPPELLLTGAVGPALTTGAPAAASLSIAVQPDTGALPPQTIAVPESAEPPSLEIAAGVTAPDAGTEAPAADAGATAGTAPLAPAASGAQASGRGRGRGRGRGGRQGAAKPAAASTADAAGAAPVAPPNTTPAPAAAKQPARPAAKQAAGKQAAAKQPVAKQPNNRAAAGRSAPAKQAPAKQAASKQAAGKQAASKQPAAKPAGRPAATKQAAAAPAPAAATAPAVTPAAGRPERRRAPRAAAKRAE